MPSSISSIAGKDGNQLPISGGILAVDKSGTGAGPFFAAQTIVDTQGVNTATVKAANNAPVAGDTAVVVGLNPLSYNANVNADPSGTNGHFGAPNVLVDQYGAYEPVAAGQTAQVLGATGAQYDYLAGLLIIPAASNCGAVSITDGNGSAITVFSGGASVGLTDLKPFMIPLGIYCTSATTPGWKVTTGSNVSALGIGKFT
jgi:hypothetical protein